MLVHCAQGMSRSGTVVVGYLMWKERLSYVTALAHAQRARPVVEPNPGFALQLQDWEQSACELTRWTGWGQEKLERCFRRRWVGMADRLTCCFTMVWLFHALIVSALSLSTQLGRLSERAGADDIGK